MSLKVIELNLCSMGKGSADALCSIHADEDVGEADIGDRPQRASSGGQPKVVMAPEASVEESADATDDDDVTVEVPRALIWLALPYAMLT